MILKTIYGKFHYGINQVSGTKTPCPDTFHYCWPDYDDVLGAPENPTLAGTGDVCPTCEAVNMTGTAVTKAFAVEYKKRLADGVCLSSRSGKFLHSNPAIPGNGICKACEKADLEHEAYCERREAERLELDYR